MGGNGRFRKWKLSIHRSSDAPTAPPAPPPKFICPIFRSLISDPMVDGSGHTFDSLCVQICRTLNFTPSLPDGLIPDFSRVIPNLAFKSTINNWCSANAAAPPSPPDYAAVERIVRQLKEKDEDRDLIDAVADKISNPNFSHAVTEVAAYKIGRFDFFGSACSSSDESVIVETETPTASPHTSFPLATRPACFSYSSASNPFRYLSHTPFPLATRPSRRELLQ